MQSVVPALKHEISMTEGDLESAAILFGALKALSRRPHQPADEDARLTAQFDQHIQSTMTSLAVKLDSQLDPTTRQSEIVNAKVQLLESCWTLLAALCTGLDDNLGLVVRRLKSLSQELFSQYALVVNDQKQYLSARALLAEEETSSLLKATYMLEQEGSKFREASARVPDLEAEILRLQDENAALAAASRTGTVSPRQRQIAQTSTTTKTSSSAFQSQAVGGERSGGRALSTPSAARTAPRGIAGPSLHASASTPQSLPGNRKMLPLAQLLSVIEALYASKVKNDARCDSSKECRQTLEQHMYTWLSSKYGLKALIQENASSILRSSERYAAVDGEVAAFKAILRNDVDEEFIKVQKSLKEAAKESLRALIKSGSPHRLDRETNAMLAERTHASTGRLSEAEWTPLVRKLYSPADADAVLSLVRREVTRYAVASSLGIDLHAQQNALTLVGSEEDLAGREAAEAEATVERAVQDMPAGAAARYVSSLNSQGFISYADLTRLLLHFQLVGHDKFLAKFRMAFRVEDVQCTGVITGEQWRRLVAQVMPHLDARAGDAIAASGDPHRTNVITFSSAVSALSGSIAAALAREKAIEGARAAGSTPPGSRRRADSPTIRSSPPGVTVPAASVSLGPASHHHYSRPTGVGSTLTVGDLGTTLPASAAEYFLHRQPGAR